MQNNKEQQSFLLLAPRDFELYKLIKRNIEFLGYNVTVVHNDGYTFRYFNIFQRISNFLRKAIFRDRTYKKRLRHEFQKREQLTILDSLPKYDVGMVIRADFFSVDFLMAAREKSIKFISYHYDGLERNPNIFNTISLFDRFFAFDPRDVKKYAKFRLRHSYNFFFDFPEENIVLKENEKRMKISYISSFHPTRIQEMIDFHKYVKSFMDSVQFDLVYHRYYEGKIPAYALDNFNCTQKIIPFEEQIRRARTSDIILDFCIAEHKGLSFRIFEGLKYEKKVITTNEAILDQEFYNAHNFFLLKDNYHEIEGFLQLPYQPTPVAIKENYSFSNWLTNVTNYPLEAFQVTPPLISIIIPCYNNERVILEAIESALNQSYAPIEVIIVDDGSTDRSADKVADYIKGMANVRLIKQENAGPSAARNNGFDYSNGEFVVFLDGDDKLHDNYIAECYNVFKKMPNLSIVYSAAELFENGSGLWDIEDYQRENILINNSIPIYAMVRSAVFEEVGKFDTNLRYAEDWELWIRVLQRYEGVHRIPKPLYYYRKRLEQNSLTDKNKEGKTLDIYYEYIYDKHRDFYVDNGLSLRVLLFSSKLVRSGKVTDKYKRKYYNEWYRKFFYYFFKRKDFREIYRENIT